MEKDALIDGNSICPIRYGLEIVGGKWKLAIICMLADGNPVRYGALRKKLGDVTNMMLSQSLKELEANGIISRKQYNVIPPKVEYTITEEGKTLLPALEMLALWGREHLKERSTGIPHCIECHTESKAI